MSDSVRPHRRQLTRVPRPWDSPSKNTGVGCHFLLQCIKVKSESEVAQSCPTPVPLVKNSFCEFSWTLSIFAKASGSNNNCLWTTKILKTWLKIQLWCNWQRNFFTAVTEQFKIIIRIKSDNILLWHIRVLGIPIISRVSKTFPLTI